MSLCPNCSVQTLKGAVCKKCEAVSFLDGVTALFNYRENILVSKLIKQFKYQGAHDMTIMWKKVFNLWEKEVGLPNYSPNTIIPVPLHPRRERERGFNQSVFIAQIINNQLTQMHLNIGNLVRIKYTKQQAKLSREERLINVKNTFIWKDEKSAPESVLLVDDIYTTGSTMQECAKILKQQGAKKVWGLVLARD